MRAIEIIQPGGPDVLVPCDTGPVPGWPHTLSRACVLLAVAVV